MLRIGDDATVGNLHADSIYVGTNSVTQLLDNLTQRVTTLETPVVIIAPVDNIAPIITLLGNSAITVSQGSVYVEPGASVTDNLAVTIVGTVDTGTPGSYTLTYTAPSDAAGNATTPVTRTVTVMVAPSYTYNFNVLGNTFNDPTLTFVDGRTATANVSGTLSWSAADGITTPAGGALQLPSVQIESVFSIEVMFRFNSATAWHNVFAFYNAPGVDAIAMMRGASANQLNVAIQNSGLQQYFLTPVMSQFGVSTSFVHVVLIRDTSGTLQMWVDGVLVAGNQGGTVAFPPVNRTYHFIGKNPTGDSGNETTKYLRIYNQALSSSDVATLYANA